MSVKSSGESSLRIGNSENAVVVVLNGKGLRHESEVVASIFNAVVEEETTDRFVLVLKNCDHLDSTFLGSLVKMNRRQRGESPMELRIIADSAVSERLFGPSNLQHYLPVDAAANFEMPTQWQTMNVDRTSSDCLYHQLDAHECLAQMDIPHAKEFGRIATALRQELQARDS